MSLFLLHFALLVGYRGTCCAGSLLSIMWLQKLCVIAVREGKCGCLRLLFAAVWGGGKHSGGMNSITEFESR